MNPITLPTLAEGASLKLTDPRPSADADFITKKGCPVDAVCVDCAVIATAKDTLAVRLLFVVVDGQDHADQPVKGRNIVTDKYLSPGAAPYTFADLRLMGWIVEDGKEVAAINPIVEGNVAAAGIGNKVVRIDLKEDSFNNTPVVRVAGISQPPQKLTGAAAVSRLSGLADMIKASKEGRPATANKGASAPRNPTSPPPAVQGGSIPPDSDMPF
jgi:hypothetical protein